jgi:uncharacterized protein YqjF (DUF2071 family)
MQAKEPTKFLTARWMDLAMANYEVDSAVLRPWVPAGTEIDLWNDRCFVSVVGFQFLDTRLLGIPIPFHRDFEEVNLRFYVKRVVGSEIRRGVVFVKEIVPRRALGRSFHHRALLGLYDLTRRNNSGVSRRTSALESLECRRM